jgi:hypothetical protein
VYAADDDCTKLDGAGARQRAAVLIEAASDELQGFLAGREVTLDDRYLAEIVEGAKSALSPDARKGWPPRLQRVRVGVMRQLRHDYGEPEQLLERDLGLDRDRLIADMAALWGKSYSAQRDELAGPGANAQKKGRVARELKAELRRVLDGES